MRLKLTFCSEEGGEMELADVGEGGEEEIAEDEDDEEENAEEKFD